MAKKPVYGQYPAFPKAVDVDKKKNSGWEVRRKNVILWP